MAHCIALDGCLVLYMGLPTATPRGRTATDQLTATLDHELAGPPPLTHPPQPLTLASRHPTTSHPILSYPQFQISIALQLQSIASIINRGRRATSLGG